jgi:hypothetical protein
VSFVALAKREGYRGEESFLLITNKSVGTSVIIRLNIKRSASSRRALLCFGFIRL